MYIYTHIYLFILPSSLPRKGEKIKETKCLLVYDFFFFPTKIQNHDLLFIFSPKRKLHIQMLPSRTMMDFCLVELSWFTG